MKNIKIIDIINNLPIPMDIKNLLIENIDNIDQQELLSMIEKYYDKANQRDRKLQQEANMISSQTQSLIGDIKGIKEEIDAESLLNNI